MLGEIILTATNAVLPIILLILLGYVLKRIKFLNDDFLKIGNKLVFKVCLPAMLFINVYDIAGLGDIKWDVVLYSVAVIVVIFALGLVTCILTTKDNHRRGVILQCTFRSNFAIIGLSLAASLGGKEAEGVAAIISAFSIPVFNILAVIALSVFAGRAQLPDEETVQESETVTIEPENKAKPAKKGGVKDILLNIVKNPLIIAVAAGLLCVGIREIESAAFGRVVFSIKDHLTFLYKTVSNLKAVATPFALIVLGGGFEFSAVKGMLKEIIVGTGWRIVLAPLIGIGGAILLTQLGVTSFGVNDYPALVALFGSPVAVSSAVMAGEMNNDEQLATQLVVWTSLCSIVTIFVTICILMGLGLLAV